MSGKLDFGLCEWILTREPQAWTNIYNIYIYIYYIFFINISHTQHCSKGDKVRGIAVSEVFGQVTVSDM